MELTTQQIATRLSAQLHGSPTQVIRGIGPLESASSDELSFFAPKSKRKTADLLLAAKSSHAGAILVSELIPDLSAIQIVTPHPYLAAVELAKIFGPIAATTPGIDPRAAVDPTVSIGAGVSIGAFSVVGKGVSIGDGTVIHPHAVIYEGVALGKNCVVHACAVVREFCKIGNDCVIQPGVVVGGDGFGYLPNPKTGHVRIPHIGITVLEDRVDLGANTTVDRATFGETRVKSGAKLDNLVMIGHNTVVGSNSFLCGQVGVSGSVSIGDNVVLAGQVGVADHTVIGNNVRAMAQAGIDRDVPEKTDVAGLPWQSANTWRRQQALLRELPKLLKRMRSLLKERDDS